MEDKINVLMVDDEAQFRATTQKILNRKGFNTIIAASGEEALEKLDANPDVVVLDIKMPGIDGHEALQEIKKRRPDLPVIMLTGHGALPSARAALGKGAFDYLSKPCDIELLAAKINEAYQHGKIPAERKEKTVGEAMVPLEAYTKLTGDQRIADAISALKSSFGCRVSTSRIMETGHRSVLVMDAGQEVIGLVAITDLLKMIMPAYLSAPKPSTADSIQYSPMFWRGMFSVEMRRSAHVQVRQIMSPAPLVIDAAASLMEAAYRMFSENARRLVVKQSGRVVGVIREQDLFFEMARVLNT
jgi:CheY-like chemotaxis protein